MALLRVNLIGSFVIHLPNIWQAAAGPTASFGIRALADNSNWHKEMPLRSMFILISRAFMVYPHLDSRLANRRTV